MRRIRTERALLISLAVASVSLPLLAEEDAARLEARSHFDRGVTLTKAGDYEAALREFELAYAAVPHYGALYNIGQAQIALGRSEAALATLQRYLDEGGAAIDATRRAEVEAMLSRARPIPPDAAVQAPPVSAGAPAVASPVKAEAYPVVASPRAVASPPPTPAPRSSASRSVAYVLGGASLALGGVALGHYWWNRGRYHDWQADYRDYSLSPSDSRRRGLNDLSRSISRASIVTVALTVGASVTLGTGVVFFVSSGPGTSSRAVDVSESTLGVRGTF